ncbi:MAG: hypothetical protein ABI678_28730, partial [Kofleriaceae bacterium]
DPFRRRDPARPAGRAAAAQARMTTYLLVLGFVGVGVAAAAIERLHHRVAIRGKPRAAPRQVEDHALVTLTGIAKLRGTPLIAPLSGRACVAFRATGRTYKLGALSGFSGGRHRTLDQEVSELVMTPFVLVTDQGEVQVDGERCELSLRGEPIIPRKLELERDFMIKAALIGRVQDAGFDEVVILAGAKVLVHGIARREVASTGGETGFREAPMQIRLTGDATHPITIGLAQGT